MRRFGIAAVAALLVLSACATGAPSQGQAVPDWVLSTPKPDSANTYFVGQAPAPGGDLATGTDDAAANLIASIMQYIGVKVSVDTSASARASLDSYSADIRADGEDPKQQPPLRLPDQGEVRLRRQEERRQDRLRARRLRDGRPREGEGAHPGSLPGEGGRGREA